ncbi:MAG: ATP-binding protein [Bacteroidia bacterium]|nr:ATP-binding protein [Bacteroidia bacterium]
MQVQVHENYQELLAFIYQCPFALAQCDPDGKIIMLNAVGAQYLVPVSLAIGLDMTNLLDIIGHYQPDLRTRIEAFNAPAGEILRHAAWKVSSPDLADEYQIFSLTVIRISALVYQYAFIDITDQVRKAEQEQQVREAQAIQTVKFETISGVLHDIGNAVMAFGSQISRMRSGLNWTEMAEMEKLHTLISRRQNEIDQALGPQKGGQLLRFVQVLTEGLTQNQTYLRQVLQEMNRTTTHIQEILDIQRRYLWDRGQQGRQLVSIAQVIHDALAMQERTFIRKGVQLRLAIPDALPALQGDQTRLVQVCLNLIKNATESFDTVTDDREKYLQIEVRHLPADAVLEILFQDNGCGFTREAGDMLMQAGYTTKHAGSGLGLSNCRRIIASHRGFLHISSPGPGLGALVSVTLPIQPAEDMSMPYT